MAGKSYIKIGSTNWDRIKKMYVKTGGQTWTAIRKAYVKTNSGWQKVFDTASNRPFIQGNDIPKLRLNTFRTDSTAGSIIDGTADDPINPVVEAPPVQRMGPTQNPPNLDSRTPVTAGWVGNQGIGRHLWGYNGDWVSGNGSTITYSYDWLFSTTGDLNYVEKEFLATSTTGRRDMITNNATHLGRDEGDYFDKNWLIFRVNATNSAGSQAAQAAPVYIVRQRPSGTINVINTGVDVPEPLSASITYASYWYNKPDVYDSYVEWFAIDALGEALTTSNRVAIEYLYDIVVTGTTTKSGTVFHNAVLPNKIYVARLTLNNSNTQAPVVPVIGFIPSAPFTAEDSTSPGSTLTVTTLNILDYYSNAGTDNRGYIPVGGLFKIQSNVTGVDGSTTYRIRYRMYNWQNASYYGMDGTNYGTAASSAWTTRTGSNTSFGFGGTLINNISVSGTTATLLHNESMSSSLFGSTTFGSGQDRWQIEIEVSALKNSVRKYYADVVGGIPYSVSRPATLLLTATPANAQVNQNVTLNGTITALGGGLSYPRQYKVSYGDGTDSGWLPVGGYAFGTSNPTFQLTKQYSATGDYFPVLTTIPDYSTSSTSVTVSPALTAPTSTSIVSMSRLNDTTIRALIGSSGGSGPYYQLYWQTGTTPTVTTGYDAAGTTSTVTEDHSFAAGTYNFFMRSSSQNLGNTVIFGNATEGTYSAYGPSTGAASYTFAVPSSATASIAGTTTVGSTLTLTTSASGSPTPTATIAWVVNDGGFGGNSFTGGTVLQNGGTTFVIPQFLYGSTSSVGYQIRAQVTYNNGMTTNATANSTAITVTAAAVAPSNTSAPTLTPTNIAVGTVLTAGVGTWSGTAPITYDLRIYRGTANVSTGETLAKSAGNVTSTTYTVTQADFDSGQRYFRTYVNATNTAGSSGFTGGQERGPIATPVAVPVNSTVPTLTGNLTVGSVLTFGVGTWTNSPTSYDLRLYRGTANVATSETLAKSAGNVTSSTYTITQADLDSGQLYFRAFATATNSGGTSNSGTFTAGQERGPITAAASAPVNTSQPTLTGNLSVGSTLTFGVGSWSGSPTSYNLRLYRGTQFVSSGETLASNAGNTTSATYVITQADFNSGQRYFRAFATATNAAGTSNGGTFTAGQEVGPITAAAVAAPVLISIAGNNSLTYGGTFSWSYSNSPTAYSIFVQGPNGTVYTTNNAYTYTGTSFRPGYDGNIAPPPFPSGNYTVYVSARNSGGDSVTSSQTTFMS